MHWIYLFAAIVAEVSATLALRASMGFTRLVPSLVVVCGYGISFYLLAQILQVIPVGVVYAIWSGAGIVLVSLLGRVLFGQRLDAAALAGIGLILAGVMVIRVFSDTVPK